MGAAPRLLSRAGGFARARAGLTSTRPLRVASQAHDIPPLEASERVCAVRGFSSSSVRCFRHASDHPGDDFSLGYAKRGAVKSESKTVAPSSTQPADTPPFTKEAKSLAERFGFLFDCDGVLHQGNDEVEGAKAALRLCHHHRARYLFLTNGGGNTTEHQKAASLKKKVRIGSEESSLVDGRVIQSHTPLTTFKESSKADQTVYITSLDPSRARDIAHSYGFKNVVTAADLLAQDENIYPFNPKLIMESDVRPLPNNAKLWRGKSPFEYDEAELRSGNYLKIDQVFVFNDPRDWSLETQIIYDILASHKGYMGTLSRKNGVQGLNNAGWQQDGQPKMWLSNMDLLWKTEYPINRFGTGAFQHAFRGVWLESTGQELQYKYMGKPSQITYEFAHDSLLRDGATQPEHGPPLRRVYMIGDNPESDIRGALGFQPEDSTEYVPILVKTGVWQETEAERQPRWQPAVIVDDVLDAVTWAMRQEGINVDRSEVEAESFWKSLHHST